MSRIVRGRYEIRQKLGGGSFGEIYRAIDLETQETVAAKFTKKRSAKSLHLFYETKVYKVLHGGNGIADFKWFGREGEDYVLLLELLGPSLEELFQRCEKKFSLKTVLMLADQMIMLIEFMHSKGILHRDIKPDNFVMGVDEKCKQVYIIDFGLSSRYLQPPEQSHIPFRESIRRIGTPNYLSCKAHLGHEQSRRDELESLGYVLLYFLNGSLPWQNETASTKGEMHETRRQKKTDLVEDLCKPHPVEFTSYMHYCKSLEFDQQPDYEYLKQLFKDVFAREGYSHDYRYDWCASRFREDTEPSDSQQIAGTTSTQPIPAAAGTSDAHREINQTSSGDLNAVKPTEENV